MSSAPSEAGQARVTLFSANGWPGRPDNPWWPAPTADELEQELKLRFGAASRVDRTSVQAQPVGGSRTYNLQVDSVLTPIAVLRAIVRTLETPTAGLPPFFEVRVDVEMQTTIGREFSSGLAHARPDAAGATEKVGLDDPAVGRKRPLWRSWFSR